MSQALDCELIVAAVAELGQSIDRRYARIRQLAALLGFDQRSHGDLIARRHVRQLRELAFRNFPTGYQQTAH